MVLAWNITYLPVLIALLIAVELDAGYSSSESLLKQSNIQAKRWYTASCETELFLPSYADYDSQELEHKQDPVEEIVLTDEEAASMLPQ